jgi:hypothetical protein
VRGEIAGSFFGQKAGGKRPLGAAPGAVKQRRLSASFDFPLLLLIKIDQEQNPNEILMLHKKQQQRDREWPDRSSRRHRIQHSPGLLRVWREKTSGASAKLHFRADCRERRVSCPAQFPTHN